MGMLINNAEYIQILSDIRTKIKTARLRAGLAINNEMVTLYWNIGVIINERSVWGNKFIENLARDIKLEMPGVTGYSVRNLKYMAKFAKIFPDFEIVQGILAQINWYHNIALMDKVKDKEHYLWYASKTIENGWSRDVLVHQIEYGLYERQALASKTTNFVKRLPDPQSELAIQTLKDPYIFDFVGYREGMIEWDIEDELVKNITDCGRHRATNRRDARGIVATSKPSACFGFKFNGWSVTLPKKKI